MAISLSREKLLGDALDVGGLDLPLVALHDVAHQSADLLEVRDAERGEALGDQRAQRRVVEAAGQVLLAELDLPADLRRLLRPALADLVELRGGLLELLAIGPDDIEHERVVHRAREALGGAPLDELALDHAEDVGGAQVLALDGLGQPVVELSLERHRRHSLTSGVPARPRWSRTRGRESGEAR